MAEKLRIAPLVWAAIGGAAATMIVGFNWGGWVTGGSADAQAEQRATTAVVTALAPMCVEKFKTATDAAVKLGELKKLSSWEQAQFMTKGGWAVPTGRAAADSPTATSCATIVLGGKS